MWWHHRLFYRASWMLLWLSFFVTHSCAAAIIITLIESGQREREQWPKATDPDSNEKFRHVYCAGAVSVELAEDFCGFFIVNFKARVGQTLRELFQTQRLIAIVIDSSETTAQPENPLWSFEMENVIRLNLNCFSTALCTTDNVAKAAEYAVRAAALTCCS